MHTVQNLHFQTVVQTNVNTAKMFLLTIIKIAKSV